MNSAMARRGVFGFEEDLIYLVDDGLSHYHEAFTVEARPRKKVILETEPTGDEAQTEIPGFKSSDVVVEESCDPDAQWITKGKTSTYGYNTQSVVDANGIVEPS